MEHSMNLFETTTFEPSDPNIAAIDTCICAHCRTRLPSDSTFCQQCGSVLALNDIDPSKFLTATTSYKKFQRISALKCIIVTIAIATAFFLIRSMDRNITSEEQNFVSESVSINSRNVYADIVYIEPIYTVSLSTDLICRCLTVENKEVWIKISEYMYTEIEKMGNDYSYAYDAQRFSEPFRIHGDVSKFEYLVDNADDSLKNQNVLVVKSLDEKEAS